MIGNGSGKKTTDTGTFWTSYSDLFSGLSVIFLVMFFFATLRLGVEQMKNANEKKRADEYLSGKVPEIVKKKNREQTDLVNKTIRDIQDKKTFLNQTARDVTQISEELNAQQNVLNEVMKDQLEKNGALQAAYKRYEEIEIKNRQLELMQKQLSLSMHERETELLAERHRVKEFNDKILALERSRQTSEVKAKELEQRYASESESARKKISLQQSELADLHTKFDQVDGVGKKLSEKLRVEQQVSLGLKNDLSNQLSELKQAHSELGNLSEQLDREKTGGKRLQALIDAQKGPLAELEKLRASNGQNRSEISDLRGEIAKKDSKIASLGRDVSDGTKRNGVCQQEADACQKEVLALSLIGAKSRALASVAQASSTPSEARVQIAQGIQKSLQQKGIEAKLNPISGVLTLSMDETIQFQSDSFKITEQAKESLRKILPIYAKKLFGKRKTAAKIAEIRIAGHASPWHRSQYLDPNRKDSNALKAAQYNKILSRKRAAQVAAFIFGKQIGSFPFKRLLKLKTKVEGKGFMEPLGPEESVARSTGDKTTSKTSQENCGPYDCSRSRRVEISFILKGEDTVIKSEKGVGK